MSTTHETPDHRPLLHGWSAPVRVEQLALLRLVSAVAMSCYVWVIVRHRPGFGDVDVDWWGVALWQASLVALFFGWHTRVAACVGLGLTLFFPGGSNLMESLGEGTVHLSLFLCMAPVGRAWSLDALVAVLRAYKDPVSGFESPAPRDPSASAREPAWSLRLIQTYVLGVYLLVALGTLTLGGSHWLSGEILFHAFQNPHIARFSAETFQLSLTSCQVLSIVSLGWAFLLPFLVFRRRWRGLMLVVGLVLHAAIALFFDAWSSGHLLLCLYPAFFSGEAVHQAVGRLLGGRPGQAYVVAYDTFCPLCRRSRRILERLDLNVRLTYVDIHDRVTMAREFPNVTYGECLEQLQVKEPNGAVYGGFFAFRSVTGVLPALRPFGPLLYIPGVPWVGQRVYRWIARQRYRLVDCENDICNLHVRALSHATIDEAEIAAIVARAREAAGLPPG